MPTVLGAVRQRTNASQQRREPFVNERMLANSVGSRSSTNERLPTVLEAVRQRMNARQQRREPFVSERALQNSLLTRHTLRDEKQIIVKGGMNPLGFTCL
ncbi:MAG: hypothetical protein LBT78_05695 [Tannerella sp.]|nr:hypothetical protein [Tannerella sp.]